MACRPTASDDRAIDARLDPREIAETLCSAFGFDVGTVGDRHAARCSVFVVAVQKTRA
jgi:hypothetical protein